MNIIDSEKELLTQFYFDRGSLQSFLKAGYSVNDFIFEAHKKLFLGFEYFYSYLDTIPYDELVKAIQNGQKTIEEVKSQMLVLLSEIKNLGKKELFPPILERWVESKQMNMFQNKIRTVSEGVEVKNLSISEAVYELGKFSGDFSAKFVKEHAKNLGANVEDYLFGLEDRRLHPELYTGVQTPFPSLNSTWRGLRPGLHFLFGREKSMKSIFSVNVAVTAAERGYRVIYISNEGGEELLKNRIMCCATGVHYDNLVSGRMTEPEKQKIREYATGILSNQSLFIKSMIPAACTVQEIEAQVKRIEDSHGPVALVIVDILSKVTTSTTKFVDQKYQEMEQVTIELKDLSDRYNLAVLALSHLNDDGDVAGSKGITRHCDTFSYLIRDEDLRGQTSAVSHFESKGVRDGADVKFDLETFFPTMKMKESTFITNN